MLCRESFRGNRRYKYRLLWPWRIHFYGISLTDQKPGLHSPQGLGCLGQ